MSVIDKKTETKKNKQTNKKTRKISQGKLRMKSNLIQP